MNLNFLPKARVGLELVVGYFANSISMVNTLMGYYNYSDVPIEFKV